MLNIKVDYHLKASTKITAIGNGNPAPGSAPKERVRKPGSKTTLKEEADEAPKKRGRKPKVVLE